MSIPILTQVYDQVRRLSIAGSVVAPQDFRLRKLVPPLEQSGKTAPVFTKVARAVTTLVDGDDRSSAGALLELSTLINAILRTQGETGLKGELEPIDSIDVGLQLTQTSARVLKPLLEALTTTGSGRLEIIKDAHERGAFLDLRLIKPALSALDDPYSEIADFVNDHILPIYGKAILPELRARFDRKGRGGDARRLVFMHQLDPEGTQDLVQQALEQGSKEVKFAAIGCLGGSPGDVAILLDQAKSKVKDIRKAALKGLSRSDSVDAVAALRAAFSGGDLELVIAPIRSSRDPEVLKFVLEAAERQRDALLANKEKDKKEVGKNAARFLSQLECLRGRDDVDTERFVLEFFAKRAALAAVKGDVGGKDVRRRLASIMAGGSNRSRAALAEAHATLSDDELSEAFRAACRAWPPRKVYDAFSPYLIVKSGEKIRKGDPATAKRAMIRGVLCEYRAWRPTPITPNGADRDEFREQCDPKWLDLAVELQDFDLAMALARPDHPAALEFLAGGVEEMLKNVKLPYGFLNVLDAMVHLPHPAATDWVITAINKCAASSSIQGLYWLVRLIPDLPREAVPKLDAMLASAPDKVVDQLLDYVTQLKNKV